MMTAFIDIKENKRKMIRSCRFEQLKTDLLDRFSTKSIKIKYAYHRNC